MATTNSRDNRNESFYRVRDLVIELLEHPTLYLNTSDLAAASIEVVAMDFKTGMPADSGPEFCDLYPRSKFDAIFKNVNDWPKRRGPGLSYAAFQMKRLVKSYLLDEGLASQSRYIWRE
jgi:hypothetical protein